MAKEIASAQCVLEKLNGYALVNKFKGKISKEEYMSEISISIFNILS